VAKQHLLLVDADPKSLRVLEVSLRKAGFTVTTAVNGREALERCALATPDLILSDTAMPELDGFELCRRLKEDERLRATPFIFLTAEKSVESKVRGLELGVEDYLTKPIYIKEIVTRVKILLQKREQERLERRDPRAGFAGGLGDMGVVDLVQAMEIGRKSGALRVLGRGGRSGIAWFREGKILDCETGRHSGEQAFYRLLNWQEGDFAVEFRQVDREDHVPLSNQAQLLEGMRRLDEWHRLAEELPPLAAVCEIDYRTLADRLAEIPDDVNRLLRLVDGKRSLEQVIEDAEGDDLSAAATLSRLFFDGVLRLPAGEPEATPVPAVVPGPSPGSGASPDEPVLGAAPTDPDGVDWSAAGPIASATTPPPRAAAPPPRRDTPPAWPVHPWAWNRRRARRCRGRMLRRGRHQPRPASRRRSRGRRGRRPPRLRGHRPSRARRRSRSRSRRRPPPASRPIAPRRGRGCGPASRRPPRSPGPPPTGWYACACARRSPAPASALGVRTCSSSASRPAATRPRPRSSRTAGVPGATWSPPRSTSTGSGAGWSRSSPAATTSCR
jgi:CheY-like chemotaxis protein